MHRLLKDALVTDGLPRVVAKQPEAQALAYAVNRQIRRLLAWADGVAMLTHLDTVEEWKLDALALNLRVTQYRVDYTIETKRAMVKKALLFRNLAGTVYVTEELAKLILGIESRVVEWFDYGDEPGYFMLQIYNIGLTDGEIGEFIKVMDEFKRLSAWLRKILLIITAPQQNLHLATGLYQTRRTMMLCLNGMHFMPGFALHQMRRTKYVCDYSHVKKEVTV